MAKITDITKQKRGNRVNLFLDGSFFCGLDELTVAKARLKIGDEISAEQIEEIQTASEEQTASDKAMAYASKYRKSVKQIKRYLLDKGYLASLVEKIVAKLEYYGYVDDKKLALDYVRYNASSRGKNKIKADLIRMEIDKEIIDDVMDEIDSQQDACALAAEKYLRSHKNADGRKLYAHLQAKGFTYSDIRKVVSDVDWEADYED